MDTLNTSSSASNIQPPTNVTSNVQNNANIKNGLPKTNVSSSGQDEDQKRLNGFFNEENAGKKSDILRPKNNSQGQAATNVLGNNNQTEQHTVPKTTSTPAPAKLAPQPTKAADKTSITHTIPIHTTTNNHTNTTSTPKQDAQTSSTTAAPTQKSTTEQSTVAPNIGDVSQSDDSSETGKKHRKHRAPVCIAGKTTDDVTLLRGKKAGNFTNIGDVGDFGMCIKRCCQQKIVTWPSNRQRPASWSVVLVRSRARPRLPWMIYLVPGCVSSGGICCRAREGEVMTMTMMMNGTIKFLHREFRRSVRPKEL